MTTQGDTSWFKLGALNGDGIAVTQADIDYHDASEALTAMGGEVAVLTLKLCNAVAAQISEAEKVAIARHGFQIMQAISGEFYRWPGSMTNEPPEPDDIQELASRVGS
jgi:hypothetical protein